MEKKDSKVEAVEQQTGTDYSNCFTKSSILQSPCECQCYTDISIPILPLNICNSKIPYVHQSKEHKLKKNSAYGRYEKYPWIKCLHITVKIFIVVHVIMQDSKTC